MNKELNDALMAKYSAIFANIRGNNQLQISCGDGWHSIIDDLCAIIQRHIDWKNGTGQYSNSFQSDDQKPIPQLRVCQVKEKFGGLRFYVTGGNDYARGAIAMAELESERTCEDCGSPGSDHERSAYVVTRCDVCDEKWLKIQEERGRNS